jgi:hypothetical protein
MAVLSASEIVLCAGQPAGAIRIHLCDTAIHFTFTALTLAWPLRRCAADVVDRAHRAGVTSDD